MHKKVDWVTGSLAILAAAALAVWLRSGSESELKRRVPGQDQSVTGLAASPQGNPVLAGQLVVSNGQPAALPGAWPQFRGSDRDGISRELLSWSTNWATLPPRQVWSIEVGEGYAGPAVLAGRVYLMDYDRDQQEDSLRCLSLADGADIWRYGYPVRVKRNHGMSRTVPAVTTGFVVAMGPKCHVVCLEAKTGKLRWGLDLVRDYGSKVPPWYAGQCPLIDGERAILVPAGPQILVLAVDCATGMPLWETPNPHGWKMTHSSIVPMDFAGHKIYLYCASDGVVGVSATDGAILWETADWKIDIATVPSPLVLDNGRIFLSGGYNAGSMMLQLKEENGQVKAETVFRLPPEVFGATQHTPIFYQGYIYGVRPDGQFVCLDTTGNVRWTSEGVKSFGLGPFLCAGGKIAAMNDSGELRLLEASPAAFHLWTHAQVLKGRESWGPMALAGKRLLVRDFTRLTCLEIGL